MDTDTPRVDACANGDLSIYPLARQLERELSEARAEISLLTEGEALSRKHGFEWKDRAERAEAECERLNRALAEIREEWAGAECGEPVTAQEAYAIQICKRMYQTAVEAIEAGKP